MGLMDELRRLANPYEDEREIDDEEEESKTTPIEQAKSYSRPADADYSSTTASRTRRTAAPVSSNTGKVISFSSAVTNAKVVVVRPKKFDDDANNLVDQLLKNYALLINLEEVVEDGDSRRLIDFLSGAAFALDGKVKKVGASIYLIAPKSVDIIGDKALLSELESSGLFSFD